jgi:toxin ParE1/3/4
MAKYVLSRKAILDLTEIWQYTCATWSEMQAEKYYDLLTGAFTTIAIHPGLGKSYEEISTGLLGIRVGQHIIFYQKLKLNQIQIIRILHVRMDLNSNIIA